MGNQVSPKELGGMWRVLWKKVHGKVASWNLPQWTDLLVA